MIELPRVTRNKDGTFGVLIKNNIPLCVTLEDKWKENRVGLSCIPAGMYECERYSGTKYKDVWIVKNVPGRSAILIHWGNTEEDTEGCILVGKEYGTLNGKRAILDSKAAYRILDKELPDRFWLNITER